MHKDLSEWSRGYVEAAAEMMVRILVGKGQSLALARETLIKAFDKAAEELDND